MRSQLNTVHEPLVRSASVGGAVPPLSVHVVPVAVDGGGAPQAGSLPVAVARFVRLALEYEREHALLAILSAASLA